MKFCKITAGCVCAAACLMMSVQAEPSVNVAVNATVPALFEMDDALDGNEDKEVQLIDEETGEPQKQDIQITPQYSGEAKIHVSSANGAGANCRVRNNKGEYLIYVVSYGNITAVNDGTDIRNNNSSAAVEFTKGHPFPLRFRLVGVPDRAGTNYEDTCTISFVAAEVA